MNAAQEIYGEGRLKAELGVAANASPQEPVSATFCLLLSASF